MVIRKSTSAFGILILLCATASAMSFTCEFECQSNDNKSTMMHYTYLKEPRLAESGYTLGYKAGSLNYLEEGSINFNDTFSYNDGQNVSSGRSSLDHEQNVDFNGKKGISEFYAKGFYPSNRAISAWKKIRYDDLSYNFSLYTAKSYDVISLGGINKPRYTIQYLKTDEKIYNSDRIEGEYNLGNSYKSSNIAMHAKVVTGEPKDFAFKYNAEVENGVVETWDATGWTNETGARRIDWEQTALMRGNINVTNNLESYGLFVPGAGESSDWIPCCFSGSCPPIDNVTNTEKAGVLAPSKILPSRELNQSGTITESKNGASRYSINSERFNSSQRGFTNITCEDGTCDGTCPGFECINTYAADEFVPTTGGSERKIVATPTILISKELHKANGKTVKSEDGRIVEYIKILDSTGEDVYINEGDIIEFQIHIWHTNATSLRNVTIVDVLPNELSYQSGNSVLYYDNSAIKIEPRPVEPVPQEGNLTWTLPADIEMNADVYIDVNFTINSTKDEIIVNRAYAVGEFGGLPYKSNVDQESVRVNPVLVS